MHFLELRLEHFRNYTSLDLACDARLNVFAGPNAQGKSNLLESMYVLSTGRSFRTSREAELVEWGASGARLAALVARETGEVQVEVRWDGKGKTVLVDGSPVARLADFSGVVTSVAFTPDDLQLVKGAPAERRRFLDIEIGQVSPAYRRHLERYHRVLRQRNKILQAFAEGLVPREAVEVWDPQLVESGARVVAGRAKAVEGLGRAAKAVHEQITDGREELMLAYRPFFCEEPGPPAGNYCAEPLATIEERFRDRLAATRAAERRFGRTVVGPQRDDLAFFIDGVELRAYGSQGQQRSAVLSVKMAEIEFMREQTGERPVLLLDDVLSELDEQRRRLFVEAAQGRVQTFITTAHLSDLGPSLLARARGVPRPGGSGIRRVLRPDECAGGRAAVFLHIGEDVVVRVDEVVAILEAGAVDRAEASRSFVELMKSEGRLKQVGVAPPHTYVVTDRAVYATPISVATLARRSGRMDFQLLDGS